MLLEMFGLEEEEEDWIPRLRVHAPLYRQGPGYRLGSGSAGCRLLRGGILGVILWLRSDKGALSSAFPLDWHLGGISPPFCLGSHHGEGSLIADWLRPVVALVTPVHGLCRSCRGQPTFSETPVGRLLSSPPGSGSPRWSRQSAAGAAGPSGGAGPLILEPWGLLGRQPAFSSDRGMPH
jgi:hypothetical protein